MELQNNLKEYHKKEHITFSCQYHVIFCPKYRRKVLEPYADELKVIFNEVAEKYDFQILEMEVMPDHVHMIVDCNPRFGIMECVTKLKGISSRTLRDKYPDLVKKLPSLWTRSAFISSVGSVSLNTVKQYIEDQKGI